MRHCDGRQFDGSACNTDLVDCAECGGSGCTGDGCDNQRYVAHTCDCGAAVSGTFAASSAA